MVGNHKIAHIELPVDDIAKAKKFYEAVFDWEVTLNTGFDDYAFFKESDDGIGGAFQKTEKRLNEEMIPYISTEDIGKTFEKIVAAGGEIVQEKTKISDEYGYYGKFKDFCGNIMGLWTRN